MTLRVESLCFSYPRRPVLHEVQVPRLIQGGLTVLIGPNAAGKSTFFRCVAGLLKASSGTISLGGTSIESLGRRTWNERVCFMPQSFTCQAALSVFDVILLARKNLSGWRVTDEDVDAVSNFLERLNISHLADIYVGDLSGGQQQMVSICQALVRTPDLFLLDEPTSALDLRHQLEIMTIIRDVTRERNIAAVVALHDLNLAARFSDELLLMSEGKIIAQGAPHEILASEDVATTYSVNVEVHKTDSGLMTVAASL